MGGGLAGLTLALQLKQRFADLDVLVLERRAHPVPTPRTRSASPRSRSARTTSTRCSASSRTCDDGAAAQVRLPLLLQRGPARHRPASPSSAPAAISPTPSYQLDRGIFENFLAEEAARRGVALHRRRDRARASTWPTTARDAPRRLSRTTAPSTRAQRALADRCLRPRRPAQAQARSGAGQRPRRQRGLVPHRRAHRDRRLVRRPGLARALRAAGALASTNHLCGPGYWVWLIPLASGSHSVGIVADARCIRSTTINSFDKAMAWFASYQPRLHRRARRQARPAAGLRLPAPLLVRLQAGVLGGALGADRRGRAVPRSVLFARQRLHRDRQHLHLPT